MDGEKRTGSIFEVSPAVTLPPALRYDERFTALAEVVGRQLTKNMELARDNVGIYYRIGQLDETVLDMLAGDLHVDWYNYEDELEEKRRVIQSSIYVHRHLGTPSAVQRVMEDSFGEGRALEWFEYGGEPHHFRLEAEADALKGSNYKKFLRLLECAKRCAEVLDGLEGTGSWVAAPYNVSTATGIVIDIDMGTVTLNPHMKLGGGKLDEALLL